MGDSFENVTYWMQAAKEESPTQAKYILVGNKCDRAEERGVSSYECRELANQFKIKYLEVSAKEGTGITEIFETLGQEIIDDVLDVPKNEVHQGERLRKEKAVAKAPPFGKEIGGENEGGGCSC